MRERKSVHQYMTERANSHNEEHGKRSPPKKRVCSSVWLERTPDKGEAGGSSPPRPTISERKRVSSQKIRNKSKESKQRFAKQIKRPLKKFLQGFLR